MEQKDLMLEQVKGREEVKEKVILIEVCYNEEIKLSSHMRERGAGAIRIGLPKHDVMKAETLEAVKQLVEEFKEEGFRPILWISVPCSPWCTWQRVQLKDSKKTLMHEEQNHWQ